MKKSKKHVVNVVELFVAMQNLWEGYRDEDVDRILRHVGKEGTKTRKDFERKFKKALGSSIAIAELVDA